MSEAWWKAADQYEKPDREERKKLREKDQAHPSDTVISKPSSNAYAYHLEHCCPHLVNDTGRNKRTGPVKVELIERRLAHRRDLVPCQTCILDGGNDV